MSLSIVESQLGGITRLKLSGHVTMGLEAGELKERLQKLVAEKKNNIIMNIDEVTYVDSFGLGELVACLTTVKKSGGSLKLVQPTEFVREVLHTTRLDTLFAPFNSDEEALASFTPQDREDSADRGAER